MGIPSESMLPSIRINDTVWINRLAYGFGLYWQPFALVQWSQPSLGDIIVFKPQAKMRAPRYSYLIKRVVGLPGDVVEVHEQRLSINGVLIRYASPSTRLQAREFLCNAKKHDVLLSGDTFSEFGPYKVPLGHVFVMGDNRGMSDDSRDWGAVNIGTIEGRAVFLLRTQTLGKEHFPQLELL